MAPGDDMAPGDGMAPGDDTAPGDDMAPGDGMATMEQILGTEADPLAQIEQQITAREYDEAVRWLKGHVAVLDSGSHRFDGALVRPLTLLGDAHAGKGQYDIALEHYQRAFHLSRVNDGLNSPNQVQIVYREAAVLKALGEYRMANDREEYAYQVLTRAHGPMDEELLGGVYHLAKWYEQTGNVFAARSLYQHGVAILQANGKLESPEAITAFSGLASSYRMERFPVYYVADTGPQSGSMSSAGGMEQALSVNNFPAGEAALQHIIRIHQIQEPLDQRALAQAVLDLADWYMLFDKTQRSVPLYAHAWELLEEIEGFDVVSYFAQPQLLYFPEPGTPRSVAASQRGEQTTGYVEIAFDVTDTGYVKNLKTVASEPDGLMDFRVRKSLRVARYRPMLVDGVPLAKETHTYRHEFPYYQDRQEEDSEESSDKTAASG